MLARQASTCFSLRFLIFDEARPRPIMLKILPTMLLSSAQKVTHYVQNYAHHHCNYATVHIQFYYVK